MDKLQAYKVVEMLRAIHIQDFTLFEQLEARKHDSLETSVNDEIEQFDHESGLCSVALFTVPLTLVNQYFSEWSKFSGNYVYPVPYNKVIKGILENEEQAYEEHINMYDDTTQYGRDRLELAAHIANCLERDYL